MGACVACIKLTRQTRKCDYYSSKLGYDVFMKPNEIHRGGSCDGYKWKKPVEVIA